MPEECVRKLTRLVRLASLANVYIEDRIIQEALEKEGFRLERIIKEKEEEQRILHLDEVGTLRKRIEDLEGARLRKVFGDFQPITLMKNPEYINRQKFWSSSWKCLICKTKTDKQGQWTCPSCRLAQRNLEWQR